MLTHSVLVAFVREINKEPVKTDADDQHKRQIHPVVERWISHTLLTHAVEVGAIPRRTCLKFSTSVTCRGRAWNFCLEGIKTPYTAIQAVKHCNHSRYTLLLFSLIGCVEISYVTLVVATYWFWNKPAMSLKAQHHADIHSAHTITHWLSLSVWTLGSLASYNPGDIGHWLASTNGYHN